MQAHDFYASDSFCDYDLFLSVSGAADRMPGVHVSIADYRTLSRSLRFLGTYQSLTEAKGRILEYGARTKAGGVAHVRSPGTWHIHHIFQKQDFAYVDFAGAALANASRVFDQWLPCVLLDDFEHVRLINSDINSEYMSQKYRPGAKRSALERSHEAKLAAAAPGRRQELIQRVEGLRELYTRVYARDRVLLELALAVLDGQRALLR